MALKSGLEAIAATAAIERPPSRSRESFARGCWIYGGGGYGQRVFKALTEHGYDCLGFIDRRAGTPRCPDLPRPVLHPDRFETSAADGRTLIVGVMNTHDSFLSPQGWSASYPFHDVLFPGHLADALGSTLDNYWMTRRDHTVAHVDDIVACASTLADATSVEIMMALARFRITGDPRFHPPVDLENQYMPPGLPIAREGHVLIDGGAYIGDTFTNLARLGVRIDEWYAFEPDLENFGKLPAAVASSSVKAAFFPCGLASETGRFSFASGEGAGSHVVAGDPMGATISVLALDETLVGVKPTLVKLDIEGYEAEALHGMRETLARARPVLAVCIYHKPSDLWELPRLVSRLMPDAKQYVRQHGHNGFDTVLYAIP